MKQDIRYFIVQFTKVLQIVIFKKKNYFDWPAHFKIFFLVFCNLIIKKKFHQIMHILIYFWSIV